MKEYLFKTKTGDTFVIDEVDLYTELLKQDFKIFGATFQCILEFRKQYQLRGGTDPMTPEKIAEMLDHRRQA